MDVIYAINARLGGGGIGNTALNAVLGPERAGRLKRVICSSNAQAAIPPRRIRSLGLLGRAVKRIAHYDKSGRLNDWADPLFDRWARAALEPSAVLHCWNDLSRTLARGNALGTLTVVECSMPHPDALAETLRAEAARWGSLPADLPSPIRLRRYRREFATARFIAVPSEYNRQTHIAQGIPSHRLRVVPYGVDTQKFHPPSELIGRHPFRVLFLGAVSLRKGAQYALEAWRQLGWRDAELWLAGHVAREMKSLLGRWRGLPGVHFVGHQRSVVDLFHQADVFVFPSLGEGSALVIFEAMACGLPVIVTENAGSLARPDQDGYIVPPADAVALADAIERMRAQPQRRCEMGRAARQRIEPYTWQSYGDRLMQTYHELLQGQTA